MLTMGQDPHLLHVEGICLLDRPYILTLCPPRPDRAYLLSDIISDLDEYLDQRAAYALLNGVLSTTDYLMSNGLVHGNTTPSNILIGNLSPANPVFWLTGFSSARPMPKDRIEKGHAINVSMAMQMNADACCGPNYFKDPVADAIFTGFLRTLQSRCCSAKEILDGSNALTYGRADSHFELRFVSKRFLIEQFLFRRHAYYRKTELGQVAWAALDAKKRQRAYNRILSAKPSAGPPSDVQEELLHWEEAQKLFDQNQ